MGQGHGRPEPARPAGIGLALPDVERTRGLVEIVDGAVGRPYGAPAFVGIVGEAPVLPRRRVVDPDLSGRARGLMAAERLFDRGARVEHPRAGGVPSRFHGGVREHHRVAAPGDRHLIELAAVFPAVRDRGGRHGVAEAGGPEQHGLTVRREGGRRLIVLVPGQPLRVTSGGRHREDVHGSEAVGREGDRSAVRRPHRGGGVETCRRQGDRVAAGGRHGPDLPGISERDAGSVGRKGRVAKPEGLRVLCRGRCNTRICRARRSGRDGSEGPQDEGRS